MPGSERKPLTGGDYPAPEVARRIEARRKELGIPIKQCVEAIGLASNSAWTKRTHPENRDWVPFRIDELSVLKPLLAPNEPGWPLFGPDEQRRVNRALGVSPPPPSEEAPPSARPAGPSRGVGRHRQ